MRILTAEECNRIDEYAINTLGIAQSLLMERAAQSVMDCILEVCPKPGKVLVLSGGGNNGGDGIALTRLLSIAGIDTDVVLLKDIDSCKDSIRHQVGLLKEAGKDYLTEIPEDNYDIIVDAILGVGLTSAPREYLANAIEHINQKAVEDVSLVFAVDLPSGLNTDTGDCPGAVVKADFTVTFSAYKPGLICYPGKENCGKVFVRSIGVDHVIEELCPEESERFCFGSEKVKLKKRLPTGNKGTFHRIGVIAGSKAMSGACVLCSEAALRGGIGLCDVYTHEINREILATSVPEAILHFYNEDMDFIEAFSDDLQKDDAIILGPGLSTEEYAKDIVFSVLSGWIDKPLIIDADALNLISEHTELKRAFGDYCANHPVVLTPHPKELSRLSGVPVAKLLADYENQIRVLAEKWNVVLVGKGNPTIVSNGKKVYYNISGNDGMATAGSGDVLAGIIGGFLLNEENVFDAVCKAVYIHGLSGDLCAEKYSHRGMIARDLIEGLTSDKIAE